MFETDWKPFPEDLVKDEHGLYIIPHNYPFWDEAVEVNRGIMGELLAETSNDLAALAGTALTAANLPIESGTWTPIIQGLTGVTIESATGAYYRIGKLCLLDFHFNLHGTATNPNVFYIEGLAFQCDASVSQARGIVTAGGGAAQLLDDECAIIAHSWGVGC